MFLVWLIASAAAAVGQEPLPATAYVSPVWTSEIRVLFMQLNAESFTPVKAEQIIASTMPSSGDRKGINESTFTNCESLVRSIAGDPENLPRKEKESKIDCRAVFVFTRSDGLRIFLGMDATGTSWEWSNLERPLPDKKTLELLRKLLPAYELESVEAWKK